MKYSTGRQKRYKLYDSLLSSQSLISDEFNKCVHAVTIALLEKSPWARATPKSNLKEMVFSLLKYGDLFINNGIVLPTPEMYRIETIIGDLVEFQYGMNPDYGNTDPNVEHFKSNEVTHIRCIKTNIKGYYPYSRSLLDVMLMPELFKDDTLNEIIDNMCAGLS